MNVPSAGDDPREEVFAKLATEVGGEFVDEEGWQFDKVRVEHGGWEVTLEIHPHGGYGVESLYTSFRAPVPPTDLRFRLFEQTLLSRVARLVGMQDIVTGDEAFDRAFVIQGSDEERMKRILADGTIRTVLAAEPEAEVTLGVSPLDPPGLELRLEVPGRVTDAARLRRLYDAFAHLLASLHAG